jgi:hypothetical protein
MLPLTVIIVEKNGNLKPLAIKEFKEEELFKKCGFKKIDGFKKQTDWSVKYPSGSSGKRYTISVYAKDDGRANNENKYDFPPPIDTKLFFGNCVIVTQVRNEEGKLVFANLSLELWEKIYEKLFGGFEDLAATALEDENEEDELENVPKNKKTKQGYLKDGFVVDSGEGSDDSSEIYDTEDEDHDDDNNHVNNNNNKFDDNVEDDEGTENTEDIGSELSEDKYDYSSADDK